MKHSRQRQNFYWQYQNELEVTMEIPKQTHSQKQMDLNMKDCFTLQKNKQKKLQTTIQLN